MNGAVIVRRYEPRDRAAVREICCDTADNGEPVESFFTDREVFADLLTRYYTDIEPGCSWVAEQGGQVVGYLVGAFDTQRFLMTMGLRIVPRTLLKAVVRGTMCKRETWQLLQANANRPKTEFNRTKILKNFPAHLHINLRKDARGNGAGRSLMERFLEQVQRAGVAGVHAGVSDANERGRAFFEKFGFVELGREPRFRKPDGPPEPAYTIIYGKRFIVGNLS